MIRNKSFLKTKEQGYALIIVLLVITVFSVLGLTVMSVSFNHTKQFSKETTQTQALNVAEMGLKAYNKELGTKIASVSGVTESNFKQKLNDDVLPEPLNSSSDSSLNSMQGNPSYTVTHGEVGDPTDNKITVTITSQGSSGGDTQTITQTKTFKYQVVSSGNTGDSDHTQPYMGLSLPYMDGALIMGSSDYQQITNPDYGSKFNIYISPYTDQKCVGWKYKTTIKDFDSKLSQIEDLFLSNTGYTDTVAQMPNQVPNVPSRIPSSPQSWAVNNANPSNAYQTSNETSSIKSGSHYTVSVLFNHNIDVDDSSGVTFDQSVSVNGDMNIKKNTVINGDLYVQGKLNLDAPLTVNGNVYVKNDFQINSTNANANITGDVYVGQNFNLNARATIGGSLNVNQSFTVNDTNAETNITGDVYSKNGVTFNAKTTIHGSLFTNSSLTVNSNGTTEIFGTLYTGGSINLSKTTTVHQKVYSVGSIIVNSSANTDFQSDVYSGGEISLSYQTNMHGNVYSTGKMTINSGAVTTNIGGDFYTGNELMINKNTTFGGNVYSNNSMTLNSGAITSVAGKLYVGGQLMVNDSLTLIGNAYSKGNVTINSAGRTDFTGYFFAAGDLTFSNSSNKPASQYGHTVYVKGTADVKQDTVNVSLDPHTLDYKQGLVVNNKANLLTNNSGVINIGPQKPGGDNGSGSGGSSGNSGQSPITIVDTKTNYQ